MGLGRLVWIAVVAGAASAVVEMIFVVIPLSAIGFSPPRSLGLFALSFAIHLLAFGLPIALTVRAMMGNVQRTR